MPENKQNLRLEYYNETVIAKKPIKNSRRQQDNLNNTSPPRGNYIQPSQSASKILDKSQPIELDIISEKSLTPGQMSRQGPKLRHHAPQKRYSATDDVDSGYQTNHRYSISTYPTNTKLSERNEKHKPQSLNTMSRRRFMSMQDLSRQSGNTLKVPTISLNHKTPSSTHLSSSSIRGTSPNTEEPELDFKNEPQRSKTLGKVKDFEGKPISFLKPSTDSSDINHNTSSAPYRVENHEINNKVSTRSPTRQPKSSFPKLPRETQASKKRKEKNLEKLNSETKLEPPSRVKPVFKQDENESDILTKTRIEKWLEDQRRYSVEPPPSPLIVDELPKQSDTAIHVVYDDDK